ncbi:MAG: glycosyltransferase family 4 protein [Bacteroidota bacterium]
MSSSQQRIALVCFSNSLGGLELSTLRLANAMKSRGAETMVIVPPTSPLQRRAQELGLGLATLAPRWKYGDIPTALRLAKLLKENRIAKVVLMQSQDIHLASLAAYYSPGVKLIFYQQMDSRHNKRDFWHTWIFSKLSLWITLTHGMKNNVLFSTRMPEAKVKVVPLGTDLYRFDPRNYNTLETRTFFGLPHEKKIIGVLGRLDPGKGQEVLIRAIPEVVKRHPDILFLIAGEETTGEPGYKAYLEKLCRAITVDKYVRFLPFTDDVPRLMAALDVFILPSFSETFGLVLIEAMAMEKPVIATNAGGPPEIIVDGKTGLLVEPRNVEAISSAIEKILGDDVLRATLANSAREEALRRFSMESCVDELLEMLATI